MRGSMGWQGEGRRFRRGFITGTAGQSLARGALAVMLGGMALIGCADAPSVPSSAAASSIVSSSAVASSEARSSAAASSAEAPARATATAAMGARPAAAERVVQRLSPVEGRAQLGSPAEAERRDEGTTSAVTARGSEPVGGDTTITPRHLEAELNRLEAELAN
jgi:hypothetical protein